MNIGFRIRHHSDLILISWFDKGNAKISVESQAELYKRRRINKLA